MRSKIPNTISFHAVALLTALLALFTLLPCQATLAEDKQQAMIGGVPSKEAMRLGKMMYREGLLPSGEPMQATVMGDMPVNGKIFPCVSCHLRSGFGSFEGGIFTPPTNGQNLFQPFQSRYKGIVSAAESSRRALRRPAYTYESLAAVLRSGIDPIGRVLDFVMPRYLLSGEDMAIMISYLMSLSSEVSPGVSETTLRFATIVTDDVSPEDRDAMLAPLEYYIRNRNNQTQAESSGSQLGSGRSTGEAVFQSREVAGLSLSLSLWTLQGPSVTWRSQLEKYYSKEPVFALIGGISRGDWKPIHEFSEEHQIPSLFPQTDFPVISETDWYTLYLSKGYYQEGEGVARYLKNMDEILKGRTIVQIVRSSPEGQALSTGFQNTWHDLGYQSPVTIRLRETERLSSDMLQQLLSRENPAVLILWDGPEALPALRLLTAAKNRPGMAFVSSGYLGKNIWSLPEQVRDFTFMAYPFSLPQDDLRYKVYMEQLTNSPKPQGHAEKILPGTYAVTRSLTHALMDMRGNYYRDNLLDVISMMHDQDIPLYERLSFGPGQRYASKGCYIVQLSKGPRPELVKKSDWVIH